MTNDTNVSPHGMINVSIPEVNMLENSSTLAVSVPIILSIKLGFVSVNGRRETYFVDELRIQLQPSSITNHVHRFSNIVKQ